MLTITCTDASWIYPSLTTSEIKSQKVRDIEAATDAIKTEQNKSNQYQTIFFTKRAAGKACGAFIFYVF